MKASRALFASTTYLVMTLGCTEVPPPAAPQAPLVAPPRPAAPKTADDSFRASPPTPGPDVVFVPPKIEEARLKNGARVLLVERHDLPIVAVQVALDCGAADAPPAVGGFAGGLLLSGTKKRSALALSDELERLGAQYGAGVGVDMAWVWGQSLTPKLGALVDVLADVVQNPAFSPDEIDRERSRRLTALAQENDRPASLLSNTVASTLYPSSHPYANSILGTEGAIKAVDRNALIRFHGQTFTPEHATISVSGDITKAELIPLLEKALGGWKGKGKDRAAVVEPPKVAAGDPRVIVVDRAGATQSNVAVALPGVPRRTKDYDALLVMNTILGGQFGSRLNMNLREKHAYTYGARSGFDMRHGPGPFTAGGAIFREKTDAAAKEILAEIERMRTSDVTDEELADAKASLIKTLPARFETASETANSLTVLAVYGLPLDEYATRPARIEKVTRADVRRVAEASLDPAQLRVVVVGDGNAIKAALGELGLGAVVVRPAPKSDAAKGAAPKSDAPKGAGPKSEAPKGAAPKSGAAGEKGSPAKKAP